MALVTTAEVCDANPQLIVSGELRALHPVFQIYGRRQVFSGPVVTLRVFEDNVLVREFLEEKGNGRVLVVDVVLVVVFVMSCLMMWMHKMRKSNF
ncbi:dimethylmenaquinone methyltransferase family protein [Dorcoceras hygrometricum]|uniref:Dimethylmenaquinone methyltransferase family protein n=1 Tax=Dorcoceras hygrometricum TaxID=472368 RepID=A0A2Z7DKX8_9LAMI|nr:dimethylmenaquinone methyltransferase family protein [Dorcoceras hygrometricum]